MTPLDEEPEMPCEQQYTALHDDSAPETRIGQELQQEFTSSRAKSDHVGFTIGIVATLAVLHRGLPFLGWEVLALNSVYLAVIAALLAWNLLDRQSYARWRTLAQAALRLETFLSPYHKQLWSQFINNPPPWHTGTGARFLNGWTFWAGLLGQSWTGLLALLSLAHPVPLWLHLPLQLLCIRTSMVLNEELCTSALLNNKVAKGLMQSVHTWANTLCLVLPLPIWQWPLAEDLVQCRRVATMSQITLGFLLPTLLLVQTECRALKKHLQGAEQRQQQEAFQARHGRSRHSAAAAAAEWPTGVLPPDTGGGQDVQSRHSSGKSKAELHRCKLRGGMQAIRDFVNQLHVWLLRVLSPLGDCLLAQPVITLQLMAILWMVIVVLLQSPLQV